MKVDWKEEYERVLHDICEVPPLEDEIIVDIYDNELLSKLIPNENAAVDCRFSMMLPDNATDEDYKAFCYYVYARSGQDFDEYLKTQSEIYY